MSFCREMQEEQILWNKQHATNLKTVLERLNDIYDTIKKFKDAKTSQQIVTTHLNTQPKSNENENEQKITPIISHSINQKQKQTPTTLKHSSTINQSKPLTTPQMTINKIKSSFQQQPSIFQLSLKKSAKPSHQSPFPVSVEKRTFETNEECSTRQKECYRKMEESPLNQRIRQNENDTKQLEEILLSIESEEMFDELSIENIKRMIPCLVGIFILGTEKKKIFVALQFLWEITRKHEILFKEKGGCVYANQLIYGLKLLQNNSGYFNVEESPLSRDELQWVMNFLLKWIN